MRKQKIISCLTLVVGIMMISVGMTIQSKNSIKKMNNQRIQQFDIKNMAASTSMIVREENNKETTETNALLEEVKIEPAPASVYVPPRVEVYNGMTMEELTAKINRSLGGILAGHGDIIASHSLELGVDPYVATAIMIHETGNGTSNIANNCYNFGGQNGSGCGAYKRYNTIEEGLRGIIDNLYRNYYAYGLNTIESIGHKYAESTEWPAKIHWYVNKISAN